MTLSNSAAHGPSYPESVVQERASSGSTRALLSVFRQLQNETLVLAIIGLFAGTLALLGVATRAANPAWSVATALLMLGLLLVAWFLRQRAFAVTSVILIGTTFAGILLTALWGEIPAALCLLAIPAGLATVLLGASWGVGVATLISALLLFPQLPWAGALAQSFVLSDDLRTVALTLVWSTVGLLWIALRPLLTAVETAWSHSERNQILLEETRDAQVQLKQVLEDLSSANVQLTRLNQLANGLRGEAETARRAKEEFVANVSHELRTPLNMIIGFSRMIVETPEVYGKREIPPALLSDLTVVLRNSQHLARLVDDVLDLSQIEANRMALTKERTDVTEILETALTVVRPLFESRQLYLRVHAEENLPPIVVDRTRICEVLLNLLSNAGRFTEAGGVTVSIARTGGDLTFGVADTGPGIASADMSKLFRPFQQLDDSLSRRHEGTGLGLTLSKRFVELHGGKMWLESQLGEGSTFSFTIPVETPPAPTSGPARWLTPAWSMVARTRPSLIPSADARPRYVVLDSVGTLTRLLTRYLDGCEVEAVADLPAAIAALNESPALALLVADSVALSANDTSQFNPHERLPTLGDLPGDTPVILCPIPLLDLTSVPAVDPQRTARNEYLQNGMPTIAAHNAAADYLVKPVSQETLVAAVMNLLQNQNGKDERSAEPPTVLIVDDEPDELRLFRRMLAASGRRFRILTAENGVEAMAILREERPDIIVSDLVMPEMDGFQLLAAKNGVPELRSIPLVIVSARDPQGQPIVAESVTALRTGGLSVPQLLACVQALSHILSPLPTTTS